MAKLLDTHALLWYITSDLKLSDQAKVIIDSKANLFFSIVSLWEISIKINIGKLQMSSSFDKVLSRIQFVNAEILSITSQDTKIYMSLPLFSQHRDPFDRMLIAQSINHSLTIVSADKAFDAYPIKRVWS